MPDPTPAPQPEMTDAQWRAADIAARAAATAYGADDLAERRLRRALDERRLTQDAACSAAQQAMATALTAGAAAQTLTATNMLLPIAPTQQPEDQIVTELLASQIQAGKTPDLAGAVTMARTIRQLTAVPKTYPAPR